MTTKQAVVEKKCEKPFSKALMDAFFQGCVGAVVGASISAVTDPIVNRVLVQRVDLAVALKSVNARKIASYFRTTLTTNLIKFPMVEVLNKAVEKIPVPDAVRGVAVGAIFTTATLPITNFRYCRSVGEPVTFGTLYKAYFPTVCRDIVYNVARTSTNKALSKRFPELQQTSNGKFMQMFVSVMSGCVASAPLNEVRGFVLQNPERKLPFNEFFQASRFVRSTATGAVSMGLSLGVSAVIAQPLQTRLTRWAKHAQGCQ